MVGRSSSSEANAMRFLTSRGQGLAEYALILSLIAILAIAALFFLSGQIQTILSVIGKSL
jgi:Flp pilus assembly pilin Flp